MAALVREVIDTLWCDRARQNADLIEERIYPDDRLAESAAAFRVRGRTCSLALECNLVGFPCRWAWTNPDYDPFDK